VPDTDWAAYQHIVAGRRPVNWVCTVLLLLLVLSAGAAVLLLQFCL
jgi:hypothetical protein